MKLEAQRALEEIYQRDGVLSPQAVLDAARPDDSPLHSFFTWNEEIAAEAYRLDEARQVIRVCVKVIPTLSNAPVRQFVSLSDLRRTGTGSYVATVDVMSDPVRAEMALSDAIKTLQSLERRFRYLPQLQGIWDALAELTTQVEAA